MTAWEWGKWVGEVDIGFDADGNIITDSSAVYTLLPVWAQRAKNADGSPRALLPGEGEEIAADAGILALIDTLDEPVKTLNAQVFAYTATRLDGDRIQVRNRETNLGNLIADAMLWKARQSDPTVQVALTNGGGIRAPIEIGLITVGGVITVLPFGNTVAKVDVTPAILKAALENGISGLNLTNPSSSAGRFAQVGGMRFTWDASRTAYKKAAGATPAVAGERITSIAIKQADGTFKALNLSDTTTKIRIVTNNFMLNGGDDYTMLRSIDEGIDLAFDLALTTQEYRLADK